MTEERIAELEKLGFKRWTKNGHDRLYISVYNLGLRTRKYNTGNISDAWMNDNRISNSQARRYIASSTYIDIKTGRVISDYDELKTRAAALAGME